MKKHDTFDAFLTPRRRLCLCQDFALKCRAQSYDGAEGKHVMISMEQQCETGRADQAVAGSAELPSPAVPLKGLQPHFMLVPSLVCQAQCSYCFGPHCGPIMSAETMEASLDFVARIADETGQRKAKVTFHGGEPLMAGHSLFRQAFAGLNRRFGKGRCEITLQSNLWLLDDEFCRLLRDSLVEVGTSLDGPEELTDSQRGLNYFARTMAGIRKAQAHGLKVACVATFTPRNALRWREVFDFFLSERLNFSIHAAVPPLEGRRRLYATDTFLKPAQYATVLREMLTYYIAHRQELAVCSLDQMCKGLGGGAGKVCTFRDCLGMFLAIDPLGDVHSCQRFSGLPHYRLGTLYEKPNMNALFSSRVAWRLRNWQTQAHHACDGCTHLDYCRGGCPYNAWAFGTGQIRDPYCDAYREAFNYIQHRLAKEMATDENTNAITESPWNRHRHPLLRKGALIELVREGPHPSQLARTAKRIIAAFELARAPDISTSAKHLVQMRICRNQRSAEASLRALWQHLHPKQVRLNNLYVHVTFNCQLLCSHCQVRAGPVYANTVDNTDHCSKHEIPPSLLQDLIEAARALCFRKVVVTGGEPLVHSQRTDLLRTLAVVRNWAAPLKLMLSTSFALPLTQEDLRQIATAFDLVSVSVDGDQITHDKRRGSGAYAITVRNLYAYASLSANVGNAGVLRLLSTLTNEQVAGAPGQAMRELASMLRIRRLDFRPLLPLGRLENMKHSLAREAIGAHVAPVDFIDADFQPVASCGLGQCMFVEPSGAVFPCRACRRPSFEIGNIKAASLHSLVQSPFFQSLATHTVDQNTQCKSCEVRYLCGGACRAWLDEVSPRSLDAAPSDCEALKLRAKGLLSTARQYVAAEQETLGKSA